MSKALKAYFTEVSLTSPAKSKSAGSKVKFLKEKLSKNLKRPLKWLEGAIQRNFLKSKLAFCSKSKPVLRKVSFLEKKLAFFGKSKLFLEKVRKKAFFLQQVSIAKNAKKQVPRVDFLHELTQIPIG